MSSKNIFLKRIASRIGEIFSETLWVGIRKGSEYTRYAKEQILKYLKGKSKSLDFPAMHINSSFGEKVLEAEWNVPYGETRSYR